MADVIISVIVILFVLASIVFVDWLNPNKQKISAVKRDLINSPKARVEKTEVIKGRSDEFAWKGI